MRSIYRLAGSGAVVALLIGCSAQQPPAAPMAAAPAAAAPAAPMTSAGGIDGVYRGPEDGVSGNSACGTTRLHSAIRVSGGKASMQTVVNGTLEGPVGPDGSLSIQQGRAMLSGKFANGQFNGAYSSGRCAFTLAYAKR